MLATLDAYADAALTLARVEVDNVIARGEPARMLELVVLGTVLGEALFAALRLLAHEHASAARLAAAERDPAAAEALVPALPGVMQTSLPSGSASTQNAGASAS